MKKYYSLVKNQQENGADVYIFGDITSWPWFEGDVSSYTLAKELAELEDVDKINVHINSYGGEVAEGLAIYNQLVKNKAKITTYCDGFACSIASVIFMAGEERIMSDASLLMIHNPWTHTNGNAKKLKKVAEDLEVMAGAAVNAYMNKINIPKEELVELLDAESWLAPDTCVEKGFATAIESAGESENAFQSAKESAFNKLMSAAPKIEINQEELACSIAKKLGEMAKAAEEKTPEPKKENQLMKIFAGLK